MRGASHLVHKAQVVYLPRYLVSSDGLGLCRKRGCFVTWPPQTSAGSSRTYGDPFCSIYEPTRKEASQNFGGVIYWRMQPGSVTNVTNRDLCVITLAIDT
jgi:hypothetical protein